MPMISATSILVKRSAYPTHGPGQGGNQGTGTLCYHHLNFEIEKDKTTNIPILWGVKTQPLVQCYAGDVANVSLVERIPLTKVDRIFSTGFHDCRFPVVLHVRKTNEYHFSIGPDHGVGDDGR
jgi:hypothetical protein